MKSVGLRGFHFTGFSVLLEAMRLTCTAVICILFLGCTPEQDRLEAERKATAAQLEQLPHLKIDTLIPTQGYSSAFFKTEDEGDQLTITFPEPKPIDTVVLVPVASLNNKNKYRPIGFPLHFKVEAQTVEGNTVCIADYTKTDFHLEGITPVVLTTSNPTPVKSLTLTATRLVQAQILNPGKYVFMLNELLVFSGEENIALNAEVSGEKPFIQEMKFAPEYLVDGYSYFPAYEPARNNPFLNFRTHADEVRLIFDLGAIQSLNEARFYPNNYMVDLPHIHSSAVGFPMEIELKLSPDPSFQDTEPIVLAQSDYPVNMSSAPLTRKLSTISGRYVQLTLRNGRRNPYKKARILSLSEIELLHNGENLLRGLPFRTEEPLVLGQPVTISPTILTDGNSIVGKIIPQKQWFLQMAHRAELEQQHAKLLLQLEQGYARQKSLVRNLLLGIPFLLLCFLFILRRSRYQHRKKIQAQRERIADDLHDETGATLSSIVNSAQLLAELSNGKNSADEAELIKDIIECAERSAKETRALILFLEKGSSQGDLIERFRNTARQMLSGLEVTLDLQAEKQFNELPSIQKWDILLFFKEVLNNIIKHAAADTVKIRTQKKGNALYLEIHDNGKGLPKNARPTHLLKRGKKLNAKIEVLVPATGGTTVTCSMPLTKNE